MAGAFAKLNGAWAGSASFFSASVLELAVSAFSVSTSAFGASSALTAGELKEAEVDVDVDVLVLALLLPNENGWLPKGAPELMPDCEEPNAGVEAASDVGLAASAVLPPAA